MQEVWHLFRFGCLLLNEEQFSGFPFRITNRQMCKVIDDIYFRSREDQKRNKLGKLFFGE